MEHDPQTIRHCVKAYLSEIRGMEAGAKDLEDRIIELRQRLEGLRSVVSETVGGSKSDDALIEGMAKLEELQDQWRGEVSKYAKEIAEAQLICDPSNIGRYACWLAWVSKLTWDQVGEKLGYSKSRIRAKAEKGIEEIYQEMPERYRWNTIPSSRWKINRDLRKDRHF